MDWKPEEIKIRVSRLLDTLVTLAMEDNIVTDEEEAIIERIRFALWSMENQFQDYIKLNEFEFRNKVQDMFDRVIQEVMMKAREDGIITSDENRLITKIKDFLREDGLSRII